ncbi:invasin [Yersinia frederiksenii]|nr:invasin [Yersinia frederiksenii]
MREAKTGTGRGWLRGTVLAVIMALVAGPTLAVLSDSTDRIQGTPPTGTVTLQALLPDGTTVVADSATLGWALIPNQFSVSPTVDNPTLSDADGDTGLSAIPDLPSATLSWTHNGTPLTPAQLAAPLGNNFAGQALALNVSMPMTVSSVTGLPTTAGPQVVTTLYTVNVDVPPTLSIDFDSDTAFVEGGVINMTVTARSSSGTPAPGTVIRFDTSGHPSDRKGNTWTGVNGPLQLDGQDIGTQTFTTGADGRVVIPVTHPGGVGVKTPFVAMTGAEAGLAIVGAEVTFAIVTSPDVPQARMFGHMAETVTANGVTFRRPYLNTEVTGDAVYTQNNETWGLYNYASAIGRVCSSEANLPTRPELEDLYAAYPSNTMMTVQGWPTYDAYRSSTIGSEGYHYVVNLGSSNAYSFSDTYSTFVACR